MMQTTAIATHLRKLGWLAVLGFTAKGVITTSLLIWAAWSMGS